jgi:hypothetical protein
MELITLYGAPFDVSRPVLPPRRRASFPVHGLGEARSVLLPILPKHSLRHDIPPQIGRPEIAERDLGGFVADLTRQLGDHGAEVARGGGEPGAERVPGTAAAVEPGVARLA